MNASPSVKLNSNEKLLLGRRDHANFLILSSEQKSGNTTPRGLSNKDFTWSLNNVSYSRPIRSSMRRRGPVSGPEDRRLLKEKPSSLS